MLGPGLGSVEGDNSLEGSGFISVEETKPDYRLLKGMEVSTLGAVSN